MRTLPRHLAPPPGRGLSNGSNGAALNHIVRYKEMLRTELRVGPGTILANLEAELALAGR